jgi:hypothetical protein
MLAEKIDEYLVSKAGAKEKKDIDIYRQIKIPALELEQFLSGKEGQPILVVSTKDFPKGRVFERYHYIDEEKFKIIEQGIGIYTGLYFQDGEIIFKTKEAFFRTNEYTHDLIKRCRWYGQNEVLGVDVANLNRQISTPLFDLLYWHDFSKDSRVTELKEFGRKVRLRDTSIDSLEILTGEEVEQYFLNGNEKEVPNKEYIHPDNFINIPDYSFLELAVKLGLSVSEPFTKLNQEKEYGETSKLVYELRDLVGKEQELSGKIAKVMGKIDTREKKGDQIMYATGPELPGIDRDDAIIMTWGEREELGRVQDSIKFSLKEAIKRDLHKTPLTIKTEIPGQVINVPQFISVLSQKYEII